MHMFFGTALKPPILRALACDANKKTEKEWKISVLKTKQIHLTPLYIYIDWLIDIYLDMWIFDG